MSDTDSVDGRTAHQLKVIDRAQKESQMKCIPLPVSKVVDYNLADFHVSLKKKFDLK